MYARAQSSARPSTTSHEAQQYEAQRYEAQQFHDDPRYGARWELDADDRAVAPSLRRRRRTGLGLLLILASVGTAGAWLVGAIEPPSAVVAELGRLGAVLETATRPSAPAWDAREPLPELVALSLLPAEQRAEIARPAAPVPSTPTASAAAVPPAIIAPALSSASPAAPEREAATGDATKPEPLPKREPPTDPLQRRAEAAGLHPDLSRALLERLTAADFRNAETAVTKAMATQADDVVVIWPKEAKGRLARFQVQFVPGDNPDCRRYVVTIAREGWLTTALPMERCGVRRLPERKQ